MSGLITKVLAAAASTPAAGYSVIYPKDDGDWYFVGEDGNEHKLSVAIPATQTEQEAGSSLTARVTPGNQHFHQSAAKAWGKISGAATPVVEASYNVSSAVKNGTANFSVNWTTPFSSANYCVVATGFEDGTGGNVVTCTVRAQTASSVTFVFFNSAGTAVNPDWFNVLAFGDQG